MNRNILASIALAAIIIVTIVAMQAQGQSVMDSLMVTLTTQLQRDQWSEAAQTVSDLQSEWRRRRPLITLNNGLDDIQRFGELLAEIRVRISTQDKSGAMSTTARLKQLWQSFRG